MEQPKPIQKLIDIFCKFPTVGSRTAYRFVFYLLSLSKEELLHISELIKNLKNDISICSSCFLPFEKIDDYGICHICRSAKREKGLLCIVEKEADLMALEKTKKYNGMYFVLGGLFKSLKKIEEQNIRIKELEERIKQNKEIKEIILAINPTVEGEETISYLTKLIKNVDDNFKITRLGRGLPQGGEMEYADEQTLENAIDGRK